MSRDNSRVKLGPNRYGKSRIRVMRVRRLGAYDELDEWTLQVLLAGDFDDAHTAGDNTRILPTDTMKNTVYSRARASQAESMEAFALELCAFFMERNAQVQSIEVTIESTLWKRLMVDGQPYPSAFMRGSDERQTTVVSQERDAPVQITSGFEGLTILKTAQSGFAGFIKDDLTTLPETTDRLFGTSMLAEWPYTPEAIATGIDFGKVRKHLREVMLATFAKHDSLSVQQTMYAMGEAALAHTGIISEVYMLMPNKHNLLVDLSRFGQDNPNQIFVPTDEPHGTIEATVVRG